MSPSHMHIAGVPLWQFTGVVIIFSILVCAPIFLCIVFHMRRARDIEIKAVRKVSGAKAPGEYELYHKNHSGSHYYNDAPDVRQPRRITSSGSNYPLLPSSPDQSRRSSVQPAPKANDASLNSNFPEHSGTVSSIAYPEAAHRGSRGRRIAYGTLGNIVDSTYTAAQRAYHGRHRLYFWSSWMTPWSRKDGLATIDEENAGSSRLTKTAGNTKHGNKQLYNPVFKVGGIMENSSGASVHTERTETTATSSFALRGTPPAFPKISEQDGYNPNMARSLTRRLLKYGFAAKDGVHSPASAMTTPVRNISGAWKGRSDLKRRASERRRLESGGGGRLFNFQKKKALVEDFEDADGGDNEDGEEEEADDISPSRDLRKTSIKDFAYAFDQIITPAKTEDSSSTGTIRRHRINDEDESSSFTQSTRTSDADSPHFYATQISQNEGPVSAAEVDSASGDKENLKTPIGTIRGRKTIRSISDTPGTQKARMVKNTPESTISRANGLSSSSSGGLDETKGLVQEGASLDDDFVDITKAVLGSSLPKKSG